MKLLFIGIWISLCTISLAQEIKKKEWYYCSPCGCKYDDKDLDGPGKCPDCGMKLLKRGTYNFEMVAVTANGTIAYESNKDNYTSKVFYRSPQRSDEKSLNIPSMPRLTRNGQNIVYSIEEKGLFIYDVGADSTTDLSSTIKLPNQQSPTWDYRDESIFFSAGKFPQLGIYNYHLQTGKLSPVLTDSATRYGVSASPDGKLLAYRCAKGNPGPSMKRGIAIYNLSTQHEQWITDIGEYPSWSPDSKSIAFHWPENKVYVLYIVLADGSGLKKITTVEQGDSEMPVWSADGKQIYFQTNRRQGNWEIWVMNADGSGQKPFIWK